MTKLKLARPVRCMAFLLGLLLIVIGTSYVFYPKNNQKEFGMRYAPANGILGEKENTIDVLLIGDSETYSAFSPMQLWKEQGFTSYISATPSQYLHDSYHYLRQASQKQQPKLVILETDAIFRDSTMVNATVAKVTRMFPVLEYHYRWKSLNGNDFGQSIQATWTDDMKGFDLNKDVSGTENTEYMVPTDEVQNIGKINEFYLRQIAKWCDEHGAQFLLVSTPSPINWNYKRHNGVQKLAEQYGFSYLDMNLVPGELNIDWENDTRDKGDHLNFYGTQKATAYLGRYLKEHYSLPDHREDADYSKWNDALARYEKVIAA